MHASVDQLAWILRGAAFYSFSVLTYMKKRGYLRCEEIKRPVSMELQNSNEEEKTGRENNTVGIGWIFNKGSTNEMLPCVDHTPT
jgi:hypothetical protein